MKKLNFLLAVCLITITLHSMAPANGLHEPNEELYKQEIEKLTKQLEKIVLMPHEKNSLIHKLISYFRQEPTISILNNKKTEVLYCSIIHSYHKLLKDPKKIRIDNEPLAQMFQEQVLGKILLHKNQLIIRENYR